MNLLKLGHIIVFLILYSCSNIDQNSESLLSTKAQELLNTDGISELKNSYLKNDTMVIEVEYFNKPSFLFARRQMLCSYLISEIKNKKYSNLSVKFKFSNNKSSYIDFFTKNQVRKHFWLVENGINNINIDSILLHGLSAKGFHQLNYLYQYYFLNQEDYRIDQSFTLFFAVYTDQCEGLLKKPDSVDSLQSFSDELNRIRHTGDTLLKRDFVNEFEEFIVWVNSRKWDGQIEIGDVGDEVFLALEKISTRCKT